jgi:hypothetical protein
MENGEKRGDEKRIFYARVAAPSRRNYQQKNINFASDILPEGITGNWDYP